MDDVIKRSLWFSSHGFNRLLLSWISLFVCVLTGVSIVCLCLNCCFYCLSVFELLFLLFVCVLTVVSIVCLCLNCCFYCLSV